MEQGGRVTGSTCICMVLVAKFVHFYLETCLICDIQIKGKAGSDPVTEGGGEGGPHQGQNG